MKRLPCLLLVSALALSPTARAGDPEPVTPESTSNARFTVEQDGGKLASTGELQAASDLYWAKGLELRDPVLVILAAETLRDLAERDRSIEAAKAGLERLDLAFDMLYFLKDGATSASWQPITSDQIPTVFDRAERLAIETEALIGEIEAEIAAAAAAPVEQDKQRGKAKPGTWWIVGGAVAVGVGLGFGAMGAVGLSIGASAQDVVEDPLVYEDEHRAAEARGRTGNILAGVGLAIAGVGVIGGAVLIAVGVKKRKAGGTAERAALAPVPVYFDGGGGLGLTGRF